MTDLIEHMTLTLQHLRSVHPKAGVIISGDRNDLSINRLLTIDTSLKQIVFNHTRGVKVLTVVLTDLYNFYQEPNIVSPVMVDIIGKGVPSDHNGVVVSPIDHDSTQTRGKKVVRSFRPLPESSILKIGEQLTKEKWEFIQPTQSATQMTDLFEKFTSDLVNNFCPVKISKSRPNESPFVTEDMKILKRRIMREYEKKGKSVKYHKLKTSFKTRYLHETNKYKEKIMNEIKSGSRASSYAALKRLGLRPGDSTKSNAFLLPNHSDRNLSKEESAELIADHFAAISSQYTPICSENFPPQMKIDFQSPNCLEAPVLNEFEVYNRIKKAKKPTSSVPGDVPVKIVKEFACEFATPVTRIFNQILKSKHYPRQWVVEYQIPIPKTTEPETEDDLRNIAKTAFFSKVFESFLATWLMPFVEPFLDPCQFGLKGGYINHYLIKLLQFITDHLDLRNPHAVVLALVDLSKAFNRISHQMVIEDLYSMKVPIWLLQILLSYLTERSMILTYNGASSTPRNLPGSTPQGTFLGIFLFVVKFNGASLRPTIPRLSWTQRTCKLKRSKCYAEACLEHSRESHFIYVDDLSEAEAINLKNQLTLDNTPKPRPFNFHERTQHHLPRERSLLQKNLTNLESYTVKNQMKINTKKTNVMIFNRSKNYDFAPEFSFSDGVHLNVIESTKLLGVMIQSDLKWKANTTYLIKKGMMRMWLLRRMKSLNLEPDMILEYYLKEIRPVMEFAAPVWTSGITKLQSNSIERIQKVALRIILGDNYSSYSEACKQFTLERLDERRERLCSNFAVKLFLSNRRRQFFSPPNQVRNTRSVGKHLVKENFTRTALAYNAPHNYLARLVNLQKKKILAKTAA